ncbi:MAG: FAD-dependent oxidoreductase [Pirellula sp.]
MKDCFALVVGSSFSGSLLAWILQSHGRGVVLIDQTQHPRFAIGESTTPTADFLLRYLSDKWGLSELSALASFGSWQDTYPELVCGKKRGFAYYAHPSEKRFTDDRQHSRSLLVAASRDDYQSDTHWLRSSVDEWLFHKALDSGVKGYENTTIESAEFDTGTHRWTVVLNTADGASHRVNCRWIVDASGGSSGLRRHTGAEPDGNWMRTRTGAIYGHFRGVQPFARYAHQQSSDEMPLFDGDDSAQHHVLPNGWLWVLRFVNGVTSVGFVLKESEFPQRMDAVERQRLWIELCRRYPSIDEMLRSSELVSPTGGLCFASRLSRCNSAALGRGWLSLPTSFGFVDPLHSTGIAHALSGVSRVADAFLGPAANSQLLLEAYAIDVRTELEWLDTLVALCYRGLPSFEDFTALACYYFVSAIGFERDVSRNPGEWPRGYMLAKDERLRASAEEAFAVLRDRSHSAQKMADWVRASIEDWNDVGLLDPLFRNRIAHSGLTKPPQQT